VWTFIPYDHWLQSWSNRKSLVSQIPTLLYSLESWENRDRDYLLSQLLPFFIFVIIFFSSMMMMMIVSFLIWTWVVSLKGILPDKKQLFISVILSKRFFQRRETVLLILSDSECTVIEHYRVDLQEKHWPKIHTYSLFCLNQHQLLQLSLREFIRPI
jgi:flagellar biosynthesis protein FlhB